MRRLALGFAAIGLAACAALPPQPASLDEGLLLVHVGAHGSFFTRFVKWADKASLVSLDAAGAPIPGERAQSGFAANGYVVFFGMTAGRYVLRDASFRARGVRYHLTVPQEGEVKRSVVLRPGTAAYLGDYRFESQGPEFGVAMGRAARIVGHWLTPFLKRPVLPRDAAMRAHETGRAQETRALLAVRSALAGTQWRRVVDARLRELSAAEPVKIEGSLRARELPLRAEPFLSWRDTLKWGEPRRAPAGLAWRRPGGQAQIAVFFTTASARGFAGWDAAVAELRRSASTSVEDRGGVYEVRVATRAGLAARTTKYEYPNGMLVGSETSVVVTETTLIPDAYGLFTARLRAPRGEFDAALPAYREFLLQLVLGLPAAKPSPRQEAVMPGGFQ
jgi:hypothetical protein